MIKRVLVLAAFCATATVARAQGETPHFLLLAPQGNRIARYIPEIQNLVDSVVAGLTGVNAIRYSEADSAFFIVCRGDSAGRRAGVLSFRTAEVLRQRIERIDTMMYPDGSVPTDIMFLKAPRAYVCLAGHSRADVWNMTSGAITGAVALPGRPASMMRLSSQRAIAICEGLHAGDSSFVVLLDTDRDSVLATRVIPGTARRGTVDRNFFAHVLSQLNDGNARVTVLRSDLTIDTTYAINGIATQISITSSIDTNFERVLISHGLTDSLVAQYNPLTRQQWARRTIRAATGIGFGGQAIGIERTAITLYDIDVAGGVIARGRTLIPPLVPLSTFLDVLPVALSGVAPVAAPSAGALRLTVFPQPANGSAQVSAIGATKPVLAVYDRLGREVCVTTQALGQGWTVDTAPLATGVYFSVVRDGSRIGTGVVTVAH